LPYARVVVKETVDMVAPQLALKLGQAPEHSQHEAAMRGRRVRPCVGPAAAENTAKKTAAPLQVPPTIHNLREH
jgi:hypothetical protein